MRPQLDELNKGLQLIADVILRNAIMPPGCADTILRAASEIEDLYHALQFARSELARADAGTELYHGANERQARMIAILETKVERLESQIAALKAESFNIRNTTIQDCVTLVERERDKAFATKDSLSRQEGAFDMADHILVRLESLDEDSTAKTE